MLLPLQFKKRSSNKTGKQQGFAVLTSAVLLSVAGIIFSANMASSQLVDNQIVGNYYRNNEAFANAESGVNFVLSQLDDSVRAQVLLGSLPTVYESASNHYRVTVEKITASRLAITSDATSLDGSANRQINLEVDFYVNFPIPTAAVSSNGKLNLDASALINDGCEGLAGEGCQSSGNIAENMLISNPDIDGSDLCTADSVGANEIASNVLKGQSSEKIITKITADDGIERYDWGQVSIPEGSQIAGLIPDPTLQASSLFEATFGMEMSQANLDKLWDNAAQIETSDRRDCSAMLQAVDDEEQIVYIKGDCNISQYYAQHSKTSENKVFTIGSAAHPKLVFIEGGTFITSANTGASVVGMLYFLPATHNLVDEQGNLVDQNGSLLADAADAIQVADASVDMGGINVNGALLSEYRCSHDGYDKSDNGATKQHFSARFDKLVLNKLYSGLGFASTASGYRLSAGTWRDF